MALGVVYEGIISGGAIATAITGMSGGNLLMVPSANGQRVVVLHTIGI